jgi:thioredoxin reductase (NADPH)
MAQSSYLWHLLIACFLLGKPVCSDFGDFSGGMFFGFFVSFTTGVIAGSIILMADDNKPSPNQFSSTATTLIPDSNDPRSAPYGILIVKRTGCGACKTAQPTIEALQNHYKGRIKIQVIEAQEAKQFGISVSGVPAFCMYREGCLVHKTQGAKSKEELIHLINENLLQEPYQHDKVNDLITQSAHDPLDIVIIGSGAAGSAAASYATRAGMSTLMIGGEHPYGALSQAEVVNNWPHKVQTQGSYLAFGLRQKALEDGAHVVDAKVTSLDGSQKPFEITLEDDRKIYAYTVIIATGVDRARLPLADEEKYWGTSILPCAFCDVNSYAQKKVALFGHGEEINRAVAHLRNTAALIYVIDTKTVDQELRATDDTKIVFRENSNITQLCGEGKQLTHIRVSDEYNNTQLLDVDALFVTKVRPCTSFLNNQLLLDDQSYIVLSGESKQTSVPGIFAAGDVTAHRTRQAIMAYAGGLEAAIGAVTYRNEGVIS